MVPEREPSAMTPAASPSTNATLGAASVATNATSGAASPSTNATLGAASVATNATSGAASASHSIFTDEELAWMKSKRVLRFTIDPGWAPLEYVENGKEQGLMAHIMHAVGRKLPMQLDFVPTTGWQDAVRRFARKEIDLLPSSVLSERDLALTGPLLEILPFYVSATIVASRADHPVVLEADNLAGQRIALATSDDNDDALMEMVPSAQLKFYRTPQLMLEAVMNGEVDVAIGPEVVLQPLIARHYRGQLATAGTLVRLPVVQKMGVSADAPMLKAVIDRALLSVNAGEINDIVQTWEGTIDYGPPSLSILWRHYKTEVALVFVLLLFLASTVMFALHMRRQTKRLAQRKLRFLANVSHEIRNAMNAVVGPLDMLSHEPVAARRLEMIDTARDGAHMLLDTVNGLLDLSTLRARKASVQAQPADVGALVDDVLRVMRPGVRANIELSAQVHADRWVVLDATKYRQVLMNLLSNAIKFTQDGAIHVTVDMKNRGRATWLSTQVSDSGVGIAPDKLEAIFEAYTQAHDDTPLAELASSRRGTGLGLMICTELVALQSGKMWAESTEDVGSTFHFELPVELGDVLPARKVLAASEAVAGQPVLVVDDNPVNLMVLRKQLEVLECAVTTCLSSREALQVWRQGQFGLVLLDCNMPDIDGYALARLMRSEESTSHRRRTSIVAVSARNDAAHMQRCRASGMDDVTVKPLQLEQLRGVLAQWLDEGKSASNSVMTPADQAIAEVFVQTNAEDLSLIRAGLAGRQAQEVVHRAHRVSGAAAVMQEHALAQAASSLEHLAQAQPPDWDAMAVACESVAQEMAAYAARYGL